MSNVLSDEKKQQVLALGRLGWSLRRIEQETGIRRETASAYLKAAGLAVRGRGGQPSEWPPKPAIAAGVSPDSLLGKPAVSVGVPIDSGAAKPAIESAVTLSVNGPKPAIAVELSPDSGELVRPERAPSASACEPFREEIAEALGKQRNAKAIWQDLVDDHGFQGAYASVKRFVAKLRGGSAVEARAVIPARRRRSTTAKGRWSVRRRAGSTGGRGSSF
jgi:hypothetical protein